MSGFPGLLYYKAPTQHHTLCGCVFNRSRIILEYCKIPLHNKTDTNKPVASPMITVFALRFGASRTRVPLGKMCVRKTAFATIASKSSTIFVTLPNPSDNDNRLFRLRYRNKFQYCFSFHLPDSCTACVEGMVPSGSKGLFPTCIQRMDADCTHLLSQA